MGNISVKSFTGEDILPYIKELGDLRMKVFREFPYLYDGTLASEEAYLNTFASAKNSVLVIAFDESQVIGASTALPLSEETPNVQQPFIDEAYDLEKIFYFGESVLLPEYRGQGIGVQFFEHREAFAKQFSSINLLTFCGVIRPEDHPRRPASYTALDQFWQNRGYSKTAMICKMEWQDLDESQESSKRLQFWIKRI